MKNRGFTLIELLVVMAIIALLTAIIFPVFASVRGKARQAVCVSNLRQIGMAISLYAQDNDDLYPYAVDPSDKYASPPIWPADLLPQIMAMPMLQDSLAPYIKSPQLWHCPSDAGFDTIDTTGSNIAPTAHPTSYDVFHTSYFYRTEIAFDHKAYSTIASYDNSCAEHDLAEVNVLMDANGSWHGGAFTDRRYDVLMGDGHVVGQNLQQFNATWQRPLTPPVGCPGYVPQPSAP